MKKILFTVMAVVLCLGLMGAAFAYFSDTETSEGNTFTAGTLDLQLDDADEPWTSESGSVIATWTAPNWAPGDPEVIAELSMRNVGSIGAKLVGIKGENLTSGLADAVLLTTITYTENGSYLYANLIGYYTGVFDANADGKVTLREFVDSPYTACFWIGNPPSDALPDYLPPGATRVESVKLGFTFPSDAGNEYQELSCSFDLRVTALQSFDQIELLGWGPASYGHGQ